MPTYQYYLFDFDGTLCHSHSAIRYCILETIAQFGFVAPAEHRLAATFKYGLSLTKTFHELLGDAADDTLITDMVANYRRIYLEQGIAKTAPFEGIAALLKTLKDNGAALAIASNKTTKSIEHSLLHFDIAHYFDLVIGDTPGITQKPNPMMYHQIVKQHYPTLNDKEVLMIGDTTTDIHFAKSIPVDVCWVRYGYGDHEECLQLEPNFIINHPHELLDIAG